MTGNGIHSYITCPNCKNDQCDVMYYYQSGEEFTLCSVCGYSIQIIKNNDDYVEIKNEKPYGILIINGDSHKSYISLESKFHLDSVIDQLKEDVTIESVFYQTIIDRQLVKTKII